MLGRKYDLGSGERRRTTSRAPQTRQVARLWGILGAMTFQLFSKFRLTHTSRTHTGLDACSCLCPGAYPLFPRVQMIRRIDAQKSHPDRVKTLVLRSVSRAHFLLFR